MNIALLMEQLQTSLLNLCNLCSVVDAQFVAPNPCFCLHNRQNVGGSKLSI